MAVGLSQTLSTEVQKRDLLGVWGNLSVILKLLQFLSWRESISRLLFHGIIFWLWQISSKLLHTDLIYRNSRFYFWVEFLRLHYLPKKSSRTYGTWALTRPKALPPLSFFECSGLWLLPCTILHLSFLHGCSILSQDRLLNSHWQQEDIAYLCHNLNILPPSLFEPPKQFWDMGFFPWVMQKKKLKHLIHKTKQLLLV